MRMFAGMEPAERLTRLEERYAHLQRHQAEQDKAMHELSEEVARLRQEIALLRVREPGQGTGGEEPEAPPPHY
jgi:uncharacterized coiled-coil protein SlyX